MQKKKAILIHLPESMVEQLDEAAQALNMARTDVIRRSLGRDIDYIVRYEVQSALQHRQERERRYVEWVQHHDVAVSEASTPAVRQAQVRV